MKLSEPIREPAEAAAFLRKAIPRGRIGLQECLVALPLDVKFRVIGSPVARGNGAGDRLVAAWTVPGDPGTSAIRTAETLRLR